MSVELLYKALESKFGIIVQTSDPERLRARLYAERKSAMNPDFEGLVFSPSKINPSSELWIIKKDPK